MAPLLAFLLDRDAVRVSGPDAIAFLQGQLSQDVEGLTVGSSAQSLVLQPQGKVDAYVRVTRTGTDEAVVDVDGGFGDALLARLSRFKLRTKAELELLHWKVVALRGSGAGGVPAPEGVLVLPVDWPGVDGIDLVAGDIPDGVELGTPEQLDALRIQAGVPAMGRELDERTIPAEAGIVEQTVSFTKGCFTGQELVARIDARGGNVPRRLRGLVLDAGDPPEPGTTVSVGGREVGTVTSAAPASAFGGAPIALAYIRRDVEVPAVGDVAGRGATISALPLQP